MKISTHYAFKRLPKTYDRLVRLLPPRPIHDDTELANVIEMIDALAGHDLNKDQRDYLDALSTFVEAYESETHEIDDSHITPLDALRFLVEQPGMNGSDIGRLLGTRTLGPAILRGERQLSKTHIKRLAQHFRVSTDLFL